MGGTAVAGVFAQIAPVSPVVFGAWQVIGVRYQSHLFEETLDRLVLASHAHELRQILQTAFGLEGFLLT